MNEKLKMLFVVKHKQAKDLAEYLGVTNSLVSRWRVGALRIHPKYYQEIADFFGISVYELTDISAETLRNIYDVIDGMNKSQRISLINYILDGM